jgi:hypothetical protein
MCMVKLYQIISFIIISRHRKPKCLKLKILQSVLMWFCDSKNKQRLFPYESLVFITEIKCVYCAVRTESFNIIQVKLGKCANGRDFLQVLRFTPLSIIPPIFRTHPHPRVTLTSRTNGWSMEPPKMQCSVRHHGEFERQVIPLSLQIINIISYIV